MRYIIIKTIMCAIFLISGKEMVYLNGVNIALVNHGDGLYKLSEGYVYKGSKPNNYFLFNNELWRIMSFENDGRIKIIKNDSIGNMAFDENNSNNWNNSSLNKYLNGNYGSYFKHYSKVSIMSMDDYLLANSNVNICNNTDLYFQNDSICHKTNYIDLMLSNVANKCAWTMSKDENGSVFYAGNTYFPDNEPRFDLCGVFPILYLNGDLKLSGNGTKGNPYFALD